VASAIVLLTILKDDRKAASGARGWRFKKQEVKTAFLEKLT
jgi:hypothetical protein